MCAWGVLYEGALGLLGRKSSPSAALLATGAAYFIDYKIVPKQYTPGIEQRLSHRSVLISYAAFAAILALSPLWNAPLPEETGDAED